MQVHAALLAIMRHLQLPFFARPCARAEHTALALARRPSASDEMTCSPQPLTILLRPPLQKSQIPVVHAHVRGGRKGLALCHARLVHFSGIDTTHLHELLAELHVELAPAPFPCWFSGVMLREQAKRVAQAAVEQEEKNGKYHL